MTCVMACALFGGPDIAEAKSYQIPDITVRAEVMPDGALVIEEDVTFRFSGRFSFAYRDIPLERGETLHEFGITDRGNTYRSSTDEQPNTYTMDRTGDGVKVTWYYDAHNEERTFKMRYIIRGAVKRHADVGELYFKFIGTGWDRGIGNVDVVIRFPADVTRPELKAWAHGPYHGEVELGYDATVHLRVAPHPARTFFETRVIFPSERLPGMAASTAMMGESILAEENRWAESANLQREAAIRQHERWKAKRERQQQLASTFIPTSVVIGLVGLGFWFMQFRKWGKAHPVRVHAVPGDIPSDHPPAVLSYLLFSRQVSASSLVATILDLAERGYIEIHESEIEKRGFLGRKKMVKDYEFYLSEKPISELAEFERELLDFMLNKAGDGTVFTMQRLKAAAQKDRTGFRKWFMSWKKLVKKTADVENFYEPYPVRSMVMNAIMGSAILAAGIVMSMITSSPSGIAAIIAGGLQAILTLTLSRHTSDGRRLAMAWRGFRSHLKSVSKALGPVSLNSTEWSRYLAVGVLFGIHKDLVEKIRLSDGDGSMMVPVWYYGMAGSGDGITSLASGFSSMVTTMSSTMSSASGAGGGASGGGGGGSGGGGGGAG